MRDLDLLHRLVFLVFAPDDGAGGGDGGDDGDGDDGGSGDGDDGEKVTVSKAEWDAALRARAEARREAKKAKAAAEKAAREAASKDGDDKKRAEEAERRAQDAEDKATRLEREGRVTRIASRLGFRDPGDAFRFLDGDELDEDSSAERALKQLKRDKPYLATGGGRSGGAIDNGDDDGKSGSMDQLIRRAAGR